jgi:hypothetical protein
LWRLDIGLGDAPELGGVASYPVLIAVAARASTAERAIGRAFGAHSIAHVGPAGRLVGRVLFGPAHWPTTIDAVVRELAGSADHELRSLRKAPPTRPRSGSAVTGSLPTQALQPPLSEWARRTRS